MPPKLPPPIDPAQLRQVATQVIRDAKFPFLATEDHGQPRVRPVSPVRVDGFTLYVANLRHYGKTREVEANPQVEVCYLTPEHDQLRITGVVDILTNRVLLEEIWAANPLLRQYMGSLDNPELIIYCIRPLRVRFMREWALEYQEVPLE